MSSIVAPRAPATPWYIWLAALAVTSAILGIEWDISWHRSIGRDSFLTPAHIAIYLCGILAGICCGYLILATTFTPSPLRAASVSVWGFRAPLGAFIAAWGGFTMLASAPFDDWWHGAYGLDVKILSPPHVVLALGIMTVELGALVLVAGEKNRASGERRAVLERIFLYVGAMMLIARMVVVMDYLYTTFQHGGRFYRVLALTVPSMLAVASRASGERWAATTVTAIYSAVQLAFIWILPLFQAVPKLGPVYHPVTHFVPPEFPLLLIIPAAALDVFWSRTRNWGEWRQSLYAGVIFVTLTLAVQWPYAIFLESPLARNAIFGMDYFDYAARPGALYFRHLFTPTEPALAAFWREIGLALAAAVLTTRVGLWVGSWLHDVRR